MKRERQVFNARSESVTCQLSPCGSTGYCAHGVAKGIVP